MNVCKVASRFAATMAMAALMLLGGGLATQEAVAQELLINGAANGMGFSYNVSGGGAPNYYIITGNNVTYEITMATGVKTTTNYIVVMSSNVTIILNNVSITTTGTNCAFSIISVNSSVKLILVGENTLISGDSRAGLEVPSGTFLTISEDESNPGGKLTAQGGNGYGQGNNTFGGGAGIGGKGNAGNGGSSGDITILSGEIHANGGNGGGNNNSGGGAGIGGGGGGSNQTAEGGGAHGIITITGGTVYAKGGSGTGTAGGAAGIGGGAGAGAGVGAIGGNNTGGININGGDIKAEGGNGANSGGGAGIGGGGGGGTANGGNGGDIEIDPEIWENIKDNINGGNGAPGIGGGGSNNPTAPPNISVFGPAPTVIFGIEGKISSILSVSATVAPTTTTLSYQWYKDGSVITGAINPTLDLSTENLTSSVNPYKFHCVVSGGSVNKTSKIVTVTIRKVIDIEVTDPTKLEYIEGQLLDLSGLVVKLIYNVGDPQTVELDDFDDNNITTAPIDGATLALADDDEPVTVTYEFGSVKIQAPTGKLVVKAKAVKSISIKKQPDNMSYIEGLPLDLTGLIVKLFYDNDTEEEVAFEAFGSNITVSLADKTPLKLFHDKKTITITHTASTKTAETDQLSVSAKSVTGIEITTQPTLTYIEGLPLDLTALKVKLTYNNNTDEEVAFGAFGSKGITVSHSIGDVLVLGDNGKKITITHTVSGKTVETAPLVISAKSLTKIEITIPPKLEYVEGQKLDLTALKVKLTYDNETSEEVVFENFVANSITVAPANATTLTVADHNNETIEVSCKGFTVETDPLVVVPKVVTSIAVKTQPTKLNYVEGQKLDLSGLVVTLTYNDNDSKDVQFANFGINDITTNPVTGVTLAIKDNDVPVTVTYEKGSVNKSVTTSPLVVVQKVVTKIEVTTQPAKLSYVVGKSLDLSGLVVTLTYNDNDTEVVPFANFGTKGIATLPTDGTQLTDLDHNKPVTISYNGLSTTTSNLTVTEKAVSGITIKTQPSNLIYVEGQQLILGGLEVELTYNDDAVEVVKVAAFGSKGISTSPPANTPLTIAAHNEKPVTVSCNGYSATTNKLTVIPKVVTVITVKTQPTKLSYIDGELLDLSGLVVTLTYNDGSTPEDVSFANFGTKGVATDPANGMPLTVAHNKQVKVSCDGISVTLTNLTVAAKIFSIALDPDMPVEFGTAIIGYGARTPQSVTVRNTGNQPTSNLTVTLSGGNQNCFELSKSSINSLPIGDSDVFTVVPVAGLAIGKYSATVTISGDNDISASIEVRFEVTPAPTYLVEIYSEGGQSAMGGGKYEEGKTVTIFAGTNPEGRHFTHWSTASPGVTFENEKSATTTFSMPANAVSVTANFAPNTYTVLFVGAGNIANQNVLHGNKLTKVTDPQKTGMTFDGWYRDEACTKNIDCTSAGWNFDNDKVTEDMTLYARWVCTVVFNSTGGSYVNSQKLIPGNKVNKPEDPTRGVEYKFSDWLDAPGGNKWSFGSDVVYNDITLYASWAPVITITTQPTDVTVMEGKITGSLTINATAPSPTALKYQWHIVGGNPIPGANSATFPIPTNLTVADGPKYSYYCVVSGNENADSVKSNVATVTVNDSDVPKIMITTQPKDITVTEGSIGNTSLSVVASVAPSVLTLNYQWYSNMTKSNTGGEPISSATSATFRLFTQLTANGSPYYYYCVVSATGATDAVSKVAIVTVNKVVTNTPELFGADLKVYPNPFAESLNLTGAEGSTLHVINGSGAVVHSQKISQSEEIIQLENLPVGVYFFRVEKDQQEKTLKVVKE